MSSSCHLISLCSFLSRHLLEKTRAKMFAVQTIFAAGGWTPRETWALSSNLPRGILWNLVQNASMYILYVYNSDIPNKITRNQNHYHHHHHYFILSFHLNRKARIQTSLSPSLPHGWTHPLQRRRRQNPEQSSERRTWNFADKCLNLARLCALYEHLTSLSLLLNLSRSFIIMDGSCEMVQQK